MPTACRCSSVQIVLCRQVTPVAALQVRKIDRKLKACHNLLLDPTSAVYKARKAAKEQEDRQHREQKVTSQSVSVLQLHEMDRKVVRHATCVLAYAVAPGPCEARGLAQLRPYGWDDFATCVT